MTEPVATKQPGDKCTPQHVNGSQLGAAKGHGLSVPELPLPAPTSTAECSAMAHTVAFSEPHDVTAGSLGTVACQAHADSQQQQTPQQLRQQQGQGHNQRWQQQQQQQLDDRNKLQTCQQQQSWWLTWRTAESDTNGQLSRMLGLGAAAGISSGIMSGLTGTTGAARPCRMECKGRFALGRDSSTTLS